MFNSMKTYFLTLLTICLYLGASSNLFAADAVTHKCELNLLIDDNEIKENDGERYSGVLDCGTAMNKKGKFINGNSPKTIIRSLIEAGKSNDKLNCFYKYLKDNEQLFDLQYYIDQSIQYNCIEDKNSLLCSKEGYPGYQAPYMNSNDHVALIAQAEKLYLFKSQFTVGLQVCEQKNDFDGRDNIKDIDGERKNSKGVNDSQAIDEN